MMAARYESTPTLRISRSGASTAGALAGARQRHDLLARGVVDDAPRVVLRRRDVGDEMVMLVRAERSGHHAARRPELLRRATRERHRPHRALRRLGTLGYDHALLVGVEIDHLAITLPWREQCAGTRHGAFELSQLELPASVALGGPDERLSVRHPPGHARVDVEPGLVLLGEQGARLAGLVVDREQLAVLLRAIEHVEREGRALVPDRTRRRRKGNFFESHSIHVAAPPGMSR